MVVCWFNEFEALVDLVNSLFPGVSILDRRRRRRRRRRRCRIGRRRNGASGGNSVAVVVDIEDLGHGGLDEVDNEEAAA